MNDKSEALARIVGVENSSVGWPSGGDFNFGRFNQTTSPTEAESPTEPK